MKTADFFNMFKSHTLKKKRNFGSYRVIDGDNCQVLVRSSTKYSMPNGSELIAISFGRDITLWHYDNMQQIKWSVVDGIAGIVIRINSTILDEMADNLLDSGVIEIDEVNKKMLIEIGDTPWLFEHESAQIETHWNWTYNMGTKIGVRCASIAEALIQSKPQHNTITALGWVMEKQPDDFTPNGIPELDRVILSKPVNPMDYGFKVEHCKKETTYLKSTVGGDLLCLKSQHAESVDGIRYLNDCKIWSAALTRYDTMKPSRYKDIQGNGGEMILIGGDEGALYLRGEFRVLYKTDVNAVIVGWHKLLRKSDKMRLKA